jgi:hypothetical protein
VSKDTLQIEFVVEPKLTLNGVLGLCYALVAKALQILRKVFQINEQYPSPD